MHFLKWWAFSYRVTCLSSIYISSIYNSLVWSTGWCRLFTLRFSSKRFSIVCGSLSPHNDVLLCLLALSLFAHSCLFSLARWSLPCHLSPLSHSLLFPFPPILSSFPPWNNVPLHTLKCPAKDLQESSVGEGTCYQACSLSPITGNATWWEQRTCSCKVPWLSQEPVAHTHVNTIHKLINQCHTF